MDEDSVIIIPTIILVGLLLLFTGVKLNTNHDRQMDKPNPIKLIYSNYQAEIYEIEADNQIHTILFKPSVGIIKLSNRPIVESEMSPLKE